MDGGNVMFGFCLGCHCLKNGAEVLVLVTIKIAEYDGWIRQDDGLPRTCA
jgi:hypothetical protein